MYYIIKTSYVGPNQDQNIDADTIDIRTAPAKTNMSHEVKINGWCGTTNDWSVHAYGEYETLELARNAINDIFGDVRDADPYDLEQDPDVVESYKIGQYIPMSEEETGDWAYEIIRSEIHDDTTDERIAELVKECEASANAEGYTLDCMLDEFMKQRRQEMLAEQHEAAYREAFEKFGFAENDKFHVALLDQAELSNRVFTGWWGDAQQGESYTDEWFCYGIDKEGQKYEVIWHFEEVKGSELEDASCYDWGDVHEIKPC